MFLHVANYLKEHLCISGKWYR